MCGSHRAPYSLLIQIERKVLSQRSGYDPSKSKGWVPRPAASVFNTIDRQGETRKTASCSTLLKRITSYKSVNSESDEDSILSRRVPSWGSCHLVDSTWVTHLNWNNFSNFVVECIGHDNDPKTKNLTRREFSGRRELAADAQHSCARCSCPP